MRNNLSIAGLFVVILLIWGAPGAPALIAGQQTKESDAKTPQIAPTILEAFSLRLINQERVERGLRPLEFDPVLTQVAREHSMDMALRGYFDHTEPQPTRRTPMGRYADALGRPPQAVVGENIARCNQPLVKLMHIELMDSAGHREMILGEAYSRAGIGLYAEPDGNIWLTQMFCTEEPQTR